MAWTPQTVKAQGIPPAVLPPISLLPPPPLPRRHWMRIEPQSLLRLSRFGFWPFEHRVSWRILSIPPAPALPDKFQMEIHPIGQDHVPKCALVLVVAVRLERPYAFSDTPIRPLSSAFKQDTQAYVKHDRYELSLDLWRMPSTGNQRPATGIDLWSLMIGMDF